MSKVFIGTSSYDTVPFKYFDVTRKVANICATNGYDLVFGCCTKGLMGELYKEYLKYLDRKITAICMKEYEKDINKLGRVDEVKTFNSTMEQMNYFMDCDKLIYLPGGYGTLTELIYLVNAKVIGIHNKEIIIVNCYGFYDKILEHFDKLLEEKFITNKSIYKVINEVENLENIL